MKHIDSCETTLSVGMFIVSFSEIKVQCQRVQRVERELSLSSDLGARSRTVQAFLFNSDLFGGNARWEGEEHAADATRITQLQPRGQSETEWPRRTFDVARVAGNLQFPVDRWHCTALHAGESGPFEKASCE